MESANTIIFWYFSDHHCLITLDLPFPLVFSIVLLYLLLAYTTSTPSSAPNFCSTVPQGFGNMPDHRRLPNGQPYFTADYAHTAANSTTPATTVETLSPQTQEYDHHIGTG